MNLRELHNKVVSVRPTTSYGRYEICIIFRNKEHYATTNDSEAYDYYKSEDFRNNQKNGEYTPKKVLKGFYETVAFNNKLK